MTIMDLPRSCVNAADYVYTSNVFNFRETIVQHVQRTVRIWQDGTEWKPSLPTWRRVVQSVHNVITLAGEFPFFTLPHQGEKMEKILLGQDDEEFSSGF